MQVPENLNKNDFSEAQIKELITAALETVRPFILSDGGDISFVSYNDGIVVVQLHGACVGCPFSTMTVTLGIEAHLQQTLPFVKKVEAI